MSKREPCSPEESDLNSADDFSCCIIPSLDWYFASLMLKAPRSFCNFCSSFSRYVLHLACHICEEYHNYENTERGPFVASKKESSNNKPLQLSVNSPERRSDVTRGPNSSLTTYFHLTSVPLKTCGRFNEEKVFCAKLKIWHLSRRLQTESKLCWFEFLQTQISSPVVPHELKILNVHFYQEKNQKKTQNKKTPFVIKVQNIKVLSLCLFMLSFLTLIHVIIRGKYGQHAFIDKVIKI